MKEKEYWELGPDWVESTEHPGYRSKTFQIGTATVEVFRPTLTPTERKKREEQIRIGAEAILRNYYRRKDREEWETQQQLQSNSAQRTVQD